MPNVPTRPAPAFRRNNPLLRGLTGDVRSYKPSDGIPAATLIDAEWESPAAFLVSGVSQGLGSLTWTLRTGIQNALLLPNTVRTNDFFSLIVFARSISLSIVAAAAGTGFVQALAIPIDLTVDEALSIANQQSINNSLGLVDPATIHSSFTSTTPANVASVPLSSGGGSGLSVVNFSPAGRNLYVKLGGPASIAAGGFTYGPIAPGGLYETPFRTSATMFGIWDGADAAGYANVTLIF
jgi:hypothetical protein